MWQGGHCCLDVWDYGAVPRPHTHTHTWADMGLAWQLHFNIIDMPTAAFLSFSAAQPDVAALCTCVYVCCMCVYVCVCVPPVALNDKYKTNKKKANNKMFMLIETKRCLSIFIHGIQRPARVCVILCVCGCEGGVCVC